MNQVLVWKDIDKLELRYAPGITPPDDFIKLSCTNNFVFLLDKSGTICYGEVSNGMFLTLNRSDIKAEDIACTSTHLFFITENGRVFKADVNNLNTYEEVILHEDANTCCHGYVTTSQRIAVKHIEAGGMGVLFLSDSGQLWAMGDYPQLDISPVDGPKKVAFFEGRHVISMACGRDFNVVVVHKRDDHCPIGNMDADEAEVFISTCPQCVNENIMSPLSPQSLTDLEIKRKHSNDSVSVSTSTSRNIDSEDKRSDNENTSSSTEGDSVHRVKTRVGSGDLDSDNSDSAEEEKNDRMSRLLMNTEAARQFFTRQLSWMSSGGEELLAEVSGPTKIIKKNVTTMASYVYEGVKTVGDKVATLSRHVSGGSDNNSESFEEFLTDDLNPSSTSSLRCEWSCSGGCSDVSGADRVGAGGEKLALYLSRGARLIKTEVWAWGGAQHGQLGSGDIVPRNKPVIVSSLMHVGAMRVECGWSHCACVTLTGRCALWGRNDLGQICDLTKGSDQSSPHVWGHTSQAVTGARHTLLLAPDSTLHWLGKHRPETLNSNNTELDISEYILDGKYTNDSSSMTTEGENGTPVNHNKENNTTVNSTTSTKGENNIHVTSIGENNTSSNSLLENNVTVTSKNGENSTTVNCSYSRKENNIAVNCVGENNTSLASSGVGNKIQEAKESKASGVTPSRGESNTTVNCVPSSRGESNTTVNGASSRGESNTTVNCVTSTMGESNIAVNSRGESNNCVTSSRGDSKTTVNCVTTSRGESNIAVNSRGENNKTVNSRGENNTTVNCLTSSRVPIRVLSSGDVSMCIVGRPPMTSDLKLNSDLANEQCFLEEMVSFHSTIVRPLSRRSCIDDIVANLCSRYADLVHLTALNVATLYQGVPSNILLHSHTDEHLLVYERYSLAVCNVIAMSAFTQIARLVEIPQRLITCFSDRLPSRKTSPESLLTFAFLSPLSRISFYKMMLSRGSSEASGEVQRWEVFCEAQDAARKLAEATRVFWESSGRLVDTLRTPQRRLLRDSKTHALTLHNASRFSNHWFILLSDAFVHISGATQTIHSLDTLWVEPVQDTDNLQNGLLITTPEDSLQLVAPSAHEKVEWMVALQDALKKRLSRSPVPTVRNASYTFTKHATYKDATYIGRWVSGKLEGKGRLEWTDGRWYVGMFRCNQLHGAGRMHMPNHCEYDGQWRDGLQNGYGCTKYQNGDVYEGYYKDGLACGYGTLKSGHFMTNSAYTYCGEWVAGQKQGYGVMDDITTGEKYMGCWNNNVRNGNGLIITRDGIYYEGIFSQNELTGQALMMLEDGAHFEGEMKSAGVLNGRGSLVLAGGDRLEGSMHGVWSEGIRVTGVFHKGACPPTPVTARRDKPKSFGKFATHPNQKWKAIFRQCYAVMGVAWESPQSQRPATVVAATGDQSQRAWEGVAAALGSAHAHRHHEKLQTIPDFGRGEHLDAEGYRMVVAYLGQAFDSNHHPLGIALAELCRAYKNTYGTLSMQEHAHLLLQHAVLELHSLIERLYQAVRCLFPALPAPGTELVISESEVASMATVLHPEILPRVCSCLFDLYTHDNEHENEAFRKRLLELNQYSDETLMSFLDIDRKLWTNKNGEFHEQPFSLAIVTLQHLKTTFIPLEKFMVLRETFERMKEEVKVKLGEDYLWTTDRIIPLLEFVIVRSQILHLASEVKFMSDFMEERFKLGEFNYHFTNLNACYKHILEEKKSVVR